MKGTVWGKLKVIYSGIQWAERPLAAAKPVSLVSVHDRFHFVPSPADPIESSSVVGGVVPERSASGKPVNHLQHRARKQNHPGPPILSAVATPKPQPHIAT